MRRFRPKIVGEQDPTHENCTLVPVTYDNALLPKLAPLVPVASRFRFNEDTRRVDAIVTPVPGYRYGEPYDVAWDACGGCMAQIRRCRCSNGVTPPVWIAKVQSEMPVVGLPKPRLPFKKGFKKFKRVPQ